MAKMTRMTEVFRIRETWEERDDGNRQQRYMELADGSAISVIPSPSYPGMMELMWIGPGGDYSGNYGGQDYRYPMTFDPSDPQEKAAMKAEVDKLIAAHGEAGPRAGLPGQARASDQTLDAEYSVSDPNAKRLPGKF